MWPVWCKPLVAWAIEAALEAQTLDRVVVSSDDEEVLQVARDLDPRLPLRRPDALAADDSPAIDYVRHAIEVVEAEGAKVDTLVILQPTSPFTTAADIDATVQLLRSSGADTAVSVMEVDHAIHPVKLKVMNGDRLLPYLEDEAGRMAAQELPRLFVRNCSVYASLRPVIDAGPTVIGPDCRGYVMPSDRSVDINTELDLAFAEFLLDRRKS